MRQTTIFFLFLLLHPLFAGAPRHSEPNFSQKVEGLLLGSLFGDALGGPVEFQPPERSALVHSGRRLGRAEIAWLADQVKLQSYPISAAPYGPWEDYGPAGTTTDDSRMKAIFFQALAAEDTLSASALARSILSYGASFVGRKAELNREWLKEFRYTARWQLGLPDRLPPDRMWGGKPSMAGQMALLLLAAIKPYDLEWTYLTAWEMDFFDTGMAKDFQAAIVTGLAAALQEGADWASVEAGMRETDPYGYGRAEFTQRKGDLLAGFCA